MLIEKVDELEATYNEALDLKRPAQASEIANMGLPWALAKLREGIKIVAELESTGVGSVIEIHKFLKGDE